MLDCQDADCPFAPDDRHSGKGVELFLTRFGPVRKVRMGGRLGKVERFHIGRDRAGQAFAHAHAGKMDSLLVEAARGKQFKHAFAQEIDRANFAIEGLTDYLHHLVELALRMET